MGKNSLLVKEVYTECEIASPAAEVYAVLSDFANIKRWTNDLIISGNTKPGGKITVKVNIPNMGWQKLSSKMIKVEQNIIAIDNMVIAPFLFKTSNRYEIIPISENKTKFINAEVISGLVLPILQLKKFTDNVRKFKENNNKDLKNALETQNTR